jgi:hypothetical protein
MSEEKKAEMEELLAVLERAKQQSWEDKQRLSQLYEEERKRNLENENKIRAVMQARAGTAAETSICSYRKRPLVRYTRPILRRRSRKTTSS